MRYCSNRYDDEDPRLSCSIELDRHTFFNIETGEILSLDWDVSAHYVNFEDVKEWNLAQYYDYTDDFLQLIEAISEREEREAA